MPLRKSEEFKLNFRGGRLVIKIGFNLKNNPPHVPLEFSKKKFPKKYNQSYLTSNYNKNYALNNEVIIFGNLVEITPSGQPLTSLQKKV